jgi:hypothetical protein
MINIRYLSEITKCWHKLSMKLLQHGIFNVGSGGSNERSSLELEGRNKIKSSSNDEEIHRQEKR